MEIDDKDITEPIPQFELDSINVNSLVSTLKVTKDDIIIIHLVGDMSDIKEYVSKTVKLLDKAGFKNPIIFMNADSYIMCVNETSVDLQNALNKLAEDPNVGVTKESTDFDISDVLGKF